MQKLFYVIITLVLLAGCHNSKKGNNKEIVAPESIIGWNYADSVINDIQLPVIPADTFYVTDFGDAGNNARIQLAIDKAFENGGGTVVIPKGIYYSGPIVLKTRINLHLKEGAELKFIPKPKLFPIVFTWFNGIPCMNYSPMIYAKNASNIQISGEGIINGQGDDPVWKNMKYYEHIDLKLLEDMDHEGVDPINRKFGSDHSLRPDLIAFIECSRIRISGVKLINTPLAAVHPILCNNIDLNHININSSGFDQVGLALESSENIRIESVLIESVNDGIKILSGRVKIPENIASRNIFIQKSEFRNIIYSAITVSIANHAGANRIFISGIEVEKARSVFKIHADGNIKGVVHDIFIKNIRADNILDIFFQCILSNTSKIDAKPLLLYNIHLEQIHVESCGRAFNLNGSGNNMIQNITLSDATFHTFKGSFAEDIKNLKFSNVTENTDTLDGIWNMGSIKAQEISLDDHDLEKSLDSDDIRFSDMPKPIQSLVMEKYPNVPIDNIQRIITKSNVIYDINLKPESTLDLELLIQQDGKLIQSKTEINFDELPLSIISALESYLKTPPVLFIMNKIIKNISKNLTYLELSGEFDNKLFAVAITADGNIIEAKQETINSYFPNFK
ncbi:MAG TPA: glycosyl hydrolase family 28 protein [Bacteroidales bacterium]|nr:glycosyl hydrolase family 28 protein [Bacteroidales bacterium]